MGSDTGVSELCRYKMRQSLSSSSPHVTREELRRDYQEKQKRKQQESPYHKFVSSNWSSHCPPLHLLPCCIFSCRTTTIDEVIPYCFDWISAASGSHSYTVILLIYIIHHEVRPWSDMIWQQCSSVHNEDRRQKTRTKYPQCKELDFQCKSYISQVAMQAGILKGV